MAQGDAPHALLSGLAWLAVAAVLVVLSTFAAAGTTSGLGSADAGRVVTALFLADLVIVAGALLGYARGLRRTPRRWLWLLGAGLIAVCALVVWGVLTLLMFNR